MKPVSGFGKHGLAFASHECTEDEFLRLGVSGSESELYVYYEAASTMREVYIASGLEYEAGGRA
jgi:hypothetical protein